MRDGGRACGTVAGPAARVVAGREDWVEAWVRIEPDVGVLDILALGAEVEVVHPAELRAAVRDVATRIAALHAGPSGPAAAPLPG